MASTLLLQAGTLLLGAGTLLLLAGTLLLLAGILLLYLHQRLAPYCCYTNIPTPASVPSQNTEDPSTITTAVPPP